MKDGAIISNAGHFNVEINVGALRKMSSNTKKIRTDIEEFTIGKKKFVFFRMVDLSICPLLKVTLQVLWI